MKKSNLHKIIQKLTPHKGQMKNKHIIAYILMLVIFGTFQFQREASHTTEINNILSHEMKVKDSLATYIEEMATALDLFTEGHPLVFTAYNALVGQTDDTPNITASNKQIFPGVLALSRELITRYGYGGNIQYGDKVWVVVPMQVEDTMNKRWRGRGDVYMLNYDEARQFGRRSGILYHEGNEVEFASAIDNDDNLLGVMN
jgi:3D (Asp-Asp-Asp) domain-containing protein